MPLFVADENTVQRSVLYHIRSIVVNLRKKRKEKFDVILCWRRNVYLLLWNIFFQHKK